MRLRPAVWVLVAVLGGAVAGWGQVILSRTFAVNEAIPDAGELVNAQTFGIAGTTVSEVVVSLVITGQGDGGFNGDLYAALSHEAAYSVLLNRSGRRVAETLGYADDGLDVVLRDDATGDIHNYRAVLAGAHEVAVAGGPTGTWQPDGRQLDPTEVLDSTVREAKLATQIGQPADGPWRLLLADTSAGGTSQLVAWGLSIRAPNLSSAPQSFTDATLEFQGAAQEVSAPLTVSGTVEIQGAGLTTFTGGIAGTGRLVQAGTGESVLSGVNTFTGGVRIESGVVSVGTAAALGSGHVTLAGGTLHTTGPSVRLESPLTVEAASTIETGGDLTLAGALIGSGALHKTGAGRLLVSAESPLYTGTAMVEAGRLFLTGSLSAGGVQVGNGGVLAGTGSAGPVWIGAGGTLSPGSSPGTISLGPTVWEGGGTYRCEINAATGTAGHDPGWDLAAVSGPLTITATSGSPFTIKLVTLQADNTSGPMVGFDSEQGYTWTIARATEGVTGLTANNVRVDATEVANALGEGHFTVSQVGNDFELVFDPTGPTAVRLDYFQATRREGKTRVSWRTLVEWDLLGFRVYRSTLSGDWELVTRSLVAATGQSHGPQRYELEDGEGESGRYRLVEVDLSGRERVLGEASVRTQVKLVVKSSPEGLELGLGGEPGASVALETATCLTGPWEIQQSVVLDAQGAGRVTAEYRGPQPVRFYRVRSSP